MTELQPYLSSIALNSIVAFATQFSIEKITSSLITQEGILKSDLCLAGDLRVIPFFATAALWYATYTIAKHFFERKELAGVKLTTFAATQLTLVLLSESLLINSLSGKTYK